MITSLFIFRRDLRIIDNTSLIEALNNSSKVIPCFIFTPEQVGNKNEYRSSNAIQFMVESLEDLNSFLKGKLNLFYGENLEILNKIKDSFDKIYFNMDYTPYSVSRDSDIREWCKKNNKELIVLEDQMLTGIDKVLTNAGKHYSKFTMYYNKAKTFPVNAPNETKINLSKIKKIKTNYSLNEAKKLYNEIELPQKGGRKNALKILSNISEFKDYNLTRDIPKIKTTMLSGHMKFGTISIREAYKAFITLKNELVQQLYWRDFYMTILWKYPNIINGSASRPEFRLIKWNDNPEFFKRWCEGKTGCPIVDAGMRQMNQTGFMHNRVRMIVANYLVFNLGINWLLGMKYFAQKLLDADWSNNQGNWQWISAIEKWSMDYFRPMSMTSQTEKFDPDGDYIKTWVPELKNVPGKALATWDISYKDYPNVYYSPLDKDWKKARMEGIDRFREAVKKYTK